MIVLTLTANGSFLATLDSGEAQLMSFSGKLSHKGIVQSVKFKGDVTPEFMDDVVRAVTKLIGHLPPK